MFLERAQMFTGATTSGIMCELASGVFLGKKSSIATYHDLPFRLFTTLFKFYTFIFLAPFERQMVLDPYLVSVGAMFLSPFSFKAHQGHDIAIWEDHGSQCIYFYLLTLFYNYRLVNIYA